MRFIDGVLGADCELLLWSIAEIHSELLWAPVSFPPATLRLFFCVHPLCVFGRVRQKWAFIKVSHKAGEVTCSLEFYFALWQKSYPEGVSLWIELCWLRGGKIWMNFLTSQCLYSQIFFCCWILSLDFRASINVFSPVVEC